MSTLVPLADVRLDAGVGKQLAAPAAAAVHRGPPQLPTNQLVGSFGAVSDTRTRILDHAVELLRDGGVLTLDSAAHAAGLSKPGVIHHFRTKQGLMLAVVDHIIDGWEADLRARLNNDEDPLDRLRAYLDYAFTGDFDSSDLVILGDTALREPLRQRWMERLEPWFAPTTGPRHPEQTAVRLIADGAWFDQALGIADLAPRERDAVHHIALELLGRKEKE